MKRFWYIVGVIVVSLLLLCGMLIGLLMSDKVENKVLQIVTSQFASKLGTEVRVGKMQYHFPARLALKDIYVEDQQQDTLLYAGELYAHFSPLALRHDEIKFSHVRLSDVVAKVYRVDSTQWNYQFLVDAFKTDEKKEKSPLQSLISVRDVQFENIRLDYEDYSAQIAHATMDLHRLSEKSIDAEVRELAAQLADKESNAPFVLEDLKARVILTDTMLSVPTLKAQLPNSKADLSGMHVRFPAGDTLYLSRSAHEISFVLAIREAELVPADIAFFVPQISHLKRPVTLKGGLNGTLDSLAFTDLALHYDSRSVLKGDISAVGLPDLEKSYIRANLVDVHTNAPRLQDFLSQLQGRPVRLPKELHRLGDIHYRGLAEGYLHDITLHGAFRTALGAITTDGSFKSDSLFKRMDFDAQVAGRKFRVGTMLDLAQMGSVSLDVKAKGLIDSLGVRGDVHAKVRHIEYNGYTYSDLRLDGRYEPQLYKGQCQIHDPHLDMSFNGIVNLRERDPEINCNLRCRHFDSSPLGIAAIGSNLRTRFNIEVDMNGVEPDRMSGYMVLDSLFLATSRDSVLMRQMTLLASAAPNGKKSISLRTDYLKAQSEGYFRYQDIVPSAQALLHHYLPAAVNAPKHTWQPVTVKVTAEGERLRDVQRLFVAPITLSDHPTLRARMSVEEDKEPFVDVRFTAPGIRVANTPIHDLMVTLNTVDTLRHEGASGSGLALSVSAEAMQMKTVFSTLAFKDTLLTHLTLRQQSQLNELLPEGWEKLSPRELQHALSNDLTARERQRALVSAQRAGNYGGDIQAITHFTRYSGRPLIDVHFQPGMLLLRDSIYTLGESRLTYCAADTTLQVDRFSFKGAGQHIRANGLASRHAKDTLSVDLQKIDASYVVPFFLPVQTIMFNGLLTGEADITSVFRRPKIETQIHVDSMGLNNCYFGDAEVDLHITDSLAFHADVNRPDRKVVDLNGKALFDGSGRWELDMQANEVPLQFINHWTSTVLHDLDGSGTGRVVVGGRNGFVYVLSRCAAKDASLTLPWTACRYTIPHDTIIMDTTAILFPHVHLVDQEGNKVEVNGGVYHEQFHSFALDLHVDAHNAIVFDNNRKGDMIQGKVYANGHVDVTGNDDDILVVANAITAKDSHFRLSLDNVSSAYQSNFIHFVTKEEQEEITKEKEETDLDNIDIDVSERVDSTVIRHGKCLVKLNIEINPQLLFQLVLGESNGDMIQGRGNGALQLAYETESSDVSLFGSYELDEGTLSYTVANVIRKNFTVGEGSTINFSGDPSNPQLDVTAKYRVTANVRDLFGDEANQLATTRSNIPVLTCLHMTGPLSSPILSFSLEFPLSDQAIQQQVKQVINTDEMLMRQVIYLLVFGRFFTPDYMNNSTYVTLNSTYSLLSSTVTSQINAWLSKLTDMVTLGVAIRTDGTDASASQEYEAQFQLHPVDRLVINGNVGYRYNDISNQPFFGDLDVEVLLTEDGQLRLKGFTHTVDKYSLRQASTIQGFGFLWKKDFNWPNRKKKK